MTDFNLMLGLFYLCCAWVAACVVLMVLDLSGVV